MKLSQLLQQGQAILEQEGDLELYGEGCYPIGGLRVEEADGLPADYYMTNGTKYIKIDIVC